MIQSDEIFLKIESHFKSDLPFVVYRKPDRSEVNVILQKDNEICLTEDYSESGFVFAPFENNRNTVLIPLSNSDSYKFIPSHFQKTEKIKKSVSEDTTNKNQHIGIVKKAIDAIKREEFTKVVLSRVETLELKDTDPIELFKNLNRSYPTAFVYCWYHPKVGLWLGATPETLLRIEGDRFETMALAGTQQYQGSMEVNWGDKEKDEQKIVTNFVVEALKNKVNVLEIMPTQTIKAGNVLHLLTKIKGTINFEKFSLKQIIEALHPTPAICGIPRDEAKQFIHKNENYDREFYTGFFGEINMIQKKLRSTHRNNIENNAYATVKKVSNLFVNLRCMQLKNDQALIYVGGGITKDSDPESEWIETVNKTNTIKKVLT